jgi:DNA-directed RNA polymerase subunit RPC12/RpoP
MSDITFECIHCKKSLVVDERGAGLEVDCPDCGGRVVIPKPFETVSIPSFAPPKSKMPLFGNKSVFIRHKKPPVKPPHIKTKAEHFGSGCLVEAIGLILFAVYFPWGIIFGIILIAVGANMARKLVCSECGNPVASDDVKICPVCKTQLSA